MGFLRPDLNKPMSDVVEIAQAAQDDGRTIQMADLLGIVTEHLRSPGASAQIRTSLGRWAWVDSGRRADSRRNSSAPIAPSGTRPRSDGQRTHRHLAPCRSPLTPHSIDRCQRACGAKAEI